MNGSGIEKLLGAAALKGVTCSHVLKVDRAG